MIAGDSDNPEISWVRPEPTVASEGWSSPPKGGLRISWPGDSYYRKLFRTLTACLVGRETCPCVFSQFQICEQQKDNQSKIRPPAWKLSELHKWGHLTTGHRLFSKAIPAFQHTALSSYALTCALPKLQANTQTFSRPACLRKSGVCGAGGDFFEDEGKGGFFFEDERRQR